MTKVLVVDDDPLIRRALTARLGHAGFKVCTAADGSQALLEFKEHGAHVIILDIMMPDIDGFEVCQAIKAENDVPVIFLTGANHPLINAYLPKMVDAVGGDYFLRKPFDGRSLLDMIDRVLVR